MSSCQLNAAVPSHLALLSKKLGYTLVFISTDYVFDGTSPPYTPSAKTNPLNLYGQTKRDGEEAVLAADAPKVVVLRVPVLYGPTKKVRFSIDRLLPLHLQSQNSDSATGKTYKMDHYATRYPTNVQDIANFLARLSVWKNPIPPILHYSGAEPFTKYEMCLIFAKILALPHGHIVPDADPPSGAGAASRPKDCQLYTGETESLGLEGGLNLSLFEEWWTDYLK
ncbi:hypothetical protein DL96DRAFT_1708212 [Flagelloscypha sp. PMI_526]|nr:hypothetical protein DL96DRAFT_1708212 [Flagelloscypha sp. PMI_526]